MGSQSNAVAQELFRYLRKAEHLTLEEELKTCLYVGARQPEIGRLWLELIRQVREGKSH
jgi:hypothetical protein